MQQKLQLPIEMKVSQPVVEQIITPKLQNNDVGVKYNQLIQQPNKI